MGWRRWRIVLCALVVLGVLVGGTVPVQAAATTLHARLMGSAAFPRARGTALFVDNGTTQVLNVGVRRARALRGTTLDVVVAGATVGKLTLNHGGAGRLVLISARGDTVPAVAAGATVEVRTSMGVVVVSGTFQAPE